MNRRSFLKRISGTVAALTLGLSIIKPDEPLVLQGDLYGDPDEVIYQITPINPPLFLMTPLSPEETRRHAEFRRKLQAKPVVPWPS